MNLCKQVSHRNFAFLWSFWGPMVHFFINGRKHELFKSLSELRSKDKKLREKQTIRILEIGIGPGSNLDFYPPRSHFVGVDINENFRQQLLDRLKGKDLVCEKLLYCSAECLKDLKDNTFDAVISTFVICSVDDPIKMVKEVNRVLTQGGKWFLFEHGAFKNRPITSFLQTLTRPAFYFCGDGCNPGKIIPKIVNSGRFTKYNITYEETKFLCLTFPFGAWYVGTVTK